MSTGTLYPSLSSPDHQIIWGRRGTGKTHALKYLAQEVRKNGDIAVFIDCRTIGSNFSIYTDQEKSISNRGTRLLLDVLSEMHEGITDEILLDSEGFKLEITGPIIDEFCDAISSVRITGPVSREITESAESRSGSNQSLSISSSELRAGVDSGSSNANSRTFTTKVTGDQSYRVDFGGIASVLRRLASVLDNRRIWVIVDEWSAIPLDLQPYLADMIRRSILPLSGFTVKIAAIQYRSAFKIPHPGGEYTGVEIGADVAADINLDDYLVFGNERHRSTEFFKDLIYKHYLAVDKTPDTVSFRNANDMIQDAFTQRNAFEELVLASEGVPRDAINIAVLAAQSAAEGKISVDVVRRASRTWYQQDKASALQDNPKIFNLLNHIIDDVIGERRARAFLLRSNLRDPRIDELFDSRLLHIVKKNISAHDQPGTRYDVYKLDYGCYVDLISTNRAPQGLLPWDNESDGSEAYIDVPPDDYRSIRRAILHLEKFDGASGQ